MVNQAPGPSGEELGIPGKVPTGPSRGIGFSGLRSGVSKLRTGGEEEAWLLFDEGAGIRARGTPHGFSSCRGIQERSGTVFSLSASSRREVNTGVGGEGGPAPRKLDAPPLGRRVAGVDSMTGVRVARALSSAEGAVNSVSYIPVRGGGMTCSRLRTVF